MQIARAGGHRRVKIAVRIEPQHEQRPPLLSGVGGNTGHGAQRKAVIAAKENRKPGRHGRLGAER